MRSPRDFFKPLAIDAPEPVREVPFLPSRMIHFLDFSNEKMVAKAPDLATKVDILLGNLEDAIPVERKEAAREGLIRVGREMDLGDTQLWTRVNSLESPWVLDDITTLVTEIGDRLEVVMVPKVEGAWDIHYVDRLLAQLEAKAGLERPILVHAILETSLGVVNLEEIATASPRMQGMSFGPADLAASRRMKTTRVGGGHPGYRVIADPDPSDPEAPRPTAQQDPWHYSIARMVDACTSAGILPYYGPYGDIRDTAGCEAQFRAAFLLGCVGAWSLHPAQIEIAKRVFSPDPEEVAFARKVLEAIPDGRGVHMIDGKMQDDATWKQCKVMVDLAERIGGPTVIKSQVLTGGRMKAGGVKFADTPDEAASYAEAILQLEIGGHMPRGVLVDPKAEGKQENYAGVVWDGPRKQPVMNFSPVGGIDIEQVAEEQPDKVGRRHFSTTQPFSDFMAKEVIASTGVTGRALTRITPILSRLASLFLERDMTLAEINPLGELQDGSFVALDAHMDMENEARPRQKALLKELGVGDEETREAREPTEFELAGEEVDGMDHRGVAGNVTEFDGDLGLVIGAGGGSLTLFDAVRAHGGRPANYCEIGGNPSVSKAKN